MFYTYLRSLLVFLIWAANGNIHYHHRDKLLPEDDNYILVAPYTMGSYLFSFCSSA